MLATLISRNANEDMVSPLVVSDGSAFGGSLESGSRFCLYASDISLASALKMFSHLIFLYKIFYTFCPFHAIYKDNAPIVLLYIYCRQFNELHYVNKIFFLLLW
jgi:hypothetical protein